MFGSRVHGGVPGLLRRSPTASTASPIHLANHDVTLCAASRAPLAKLQAYKRRMGWTFPWASALGSDFNYDFNASYTKEEQREEGIEYNYQREEPLAEIPSRSTPDGPSTFAAMTGTDVATYTRERPGMSAFVLEDGVVYHTYSAYARGLDGLWGIFQWLDRAPRGRNEPGAWFRRHDEYNGRPSRGPHIAVITTDTKTTQQEGDVS